MVALERVPRVADARPLVQGRRRRRQAAGQDVGLDRRRIFNVFAVGEEVLEGQQAALVRAEEVVAVAPERLRGVEDDRLEFTRAAHGLQISLEVGVGPPPVSIRIEGVEERPCQVDAAPAQPRLAVVIRPRRAGEFGLGGPGLAEGLGVPGQRRVLRLAELLADAPQQRYDGAAPVLLPHPLGLLVF